MAPALYAIATMEEHINQEEKKARKAAKCNLHGGVYETLLLRNGGLAAVLCFMYDMLVLTEARMDDGPWMGGVQRLYIPVLCKIKIHSCLGKNIAVV